jgi:phosphatidylinositol alpha-1,6-mannosyltransferase
MALLGLSAGRCRCYPPAMPPRPLLLVTPDLDSQPGGIARVARAVRHAFGRAAPGLGLQLEVLALHDRPSRDGVPPGDAPVHGFAGDRRALAAAFLRRVWAGRARAAVFLHPNLAPLALPTPPSLRVAVMAHGIEVWTRLRLERRLALRRADAVWAIGEDTAGRLTGVQGLPARRVTVVPNGLDPDWALPPRPEAGARPRAGRHLLAVARLHPDDAYKGVDRTLEALARLDAPPPLVVAGDGPDRPRLEALSRTLGVEARFPGRVDDATLAALYRDALAFVLPSTGEGFGLVYLEAMAASLPCVAARAGGAPEVVIDGETGVVVPPHDLAALAAAIARVSGPEGAALGLAGRARLEARFLYPAWESRLQAALGALLG